MDNQASLKAQRSLFHRYEKNPILSPDDWPYVANATFNPGAAAFSGGTILLVRVEDMRGFSHLTIARSADGKTDWRVDEHPALKPEAESHEEQWGLEDPRIVFLEEREEYAITYVSFSSSGPLVSRALTQDFESFRRVGPIMPHEDKDA